MSKLEFTAEDFYYTYVNPTTPEGLADAANARLAEMLAAAPVVYGNKSARGLWTFDEQPLPVDTHRARLVEIERIENGNVEADRNRTAG